MKASNVEEGKWITVNAGMDAAEESGRIRQTDALKNTQNREKERKSERDRYIDR